MKKLLSLMLLCTVCLVFTTCGDDDKEEPEKFVWGGDWNDPDDPNYKPEYEGKYNPIKGVWRMDFDPTRGTMYTDDFECHIVFFYSDGKYKTEYWKDYILNDKAIKYSDGTWRYKIENGKLMMTNSLNQEKGWTSYTRVEEKE